jgi:hypothetical protein
MSAAKPRRRNRMRRAPGESIPGPDGWPCASPLMVALYTASGGHPISVRRAAAVITHARRSATGAEPPSSWAVSKLARWVRAGSLEAVGKDPEDESVVRLTPRAIDAICAGRVRRAA